MNENFDIEKNSTGENIVLSGTTVKSVIIWIIVLCFIFFAVVPLAAIYLTKDVAKAYLTKGR